jgi:phospholipid/cholesterol/gamma-HCH transport system substrate-binding protein
MTASQKIRIGILTVVAGGLVAVVIAVWGGLHLFKHRVRYAIELDGSVYGLSRGAEVFYNGIPVGTVRSIGIAAEDIRKIRIQISVEEDTPVRADTKAALSMTGITGSKVIDLRPGSPGSPPLAEGSVIALGETTFDKLEHELEDITGKSRQLLERADRIEASAETAMSNLATITDPRQFTALVGQSRDAIAQLAHATSAIRGVVDDNRAPLRSAIADLRQASRSFKELAREVREQPSRILISSPKGDRKLP